MARIETWFDQDLKNPVPVRVLTGSAFSLDNLGNLIGVRVTDGGEIITLAGSVNGYCMLADGQTIPVSGSRSGNMASIVLPQTAYTVPGPIRISIKLTEGSAITTLLACVGTVVRTKTGNIVNPGSVVQDWSTQISAQLQACQDAADNMGAIVAVAFNPSSAYSVGNYVTYQGALYRITAAHAAGTTWADTSKTQVTVSAELSDLKSAFNQNSNIELIQLTKGYYIDVSGSTTSFTPKPSASFNDGGYAIVDCNEGDVFTINGTGGSTGRLWAFTKANGDILLKSNASVTEEDLIIIAPADVAKLVVNSTENSLLCKGITPGINDNDLIQIDTSFLGVEKIHIFKEGAIVTDGSTVNLDSVDYPNTRFRHEVVGCHGGEAFTITGSAGSSYRLWTFIDSNNNVLEPRGASSESATEKVITAPTDAVKLVVNFIVANKHELYKGQKVANVKAEIDTDISLGNKKRESAINLFGIKTIEGWNEKHAISMTSSNIADAVASPVATLSWDCIVLSCSFGDAFIVNGNSGTAPKAVAFTDSSYNILYTEGSATVINKLLFAPMNSAYIVINRRRDLTNLESYIGQVKIKTGIDQNNLEIHLTEPYDNIWTYWNYPQVISFKGVRNKLYWGYTTKAGYCGVAEYDFETKKVRKTHLKKNHVDDHNATAVHVFQDGTIICGYPSGHNIDNYMHIRRSICPESIDDWTDDICLPSSQVVCYCQFIEYSNKLYMFHRVGDYNWAYRFSTDKGVTWSDEVVLITSTMKYYCKFVPTTTEGLVRIIMYSNPSSGDSAIRQGFMDLNTNKVYNSDGRTELGMDSIAYTNFTIIIPIAEGYSTQRLYDVAVTQPDRPLILYAPLYSNNDNTVYRIYDKGNIVDICETGYFLLSTVPLGCSWIGSNRIIVCHGTSAGGGTDRVDIYGYEDGTVNIVDEIWSEQRTSAGIRNNRPMVDPNGKAFIWQRGYYSFSNPAFDDFNMDARIHELT